MNHHHCEIGEHGNSFFCSQLAFHRSVETGKTVDWIHFETISTRRSFGRRSCKPRSRLLSSLFTTRTTSISYVSSGTQCVSIRRSITMSFDRPSILRIKVCTAIELLYSIGNGAINHFSTPKFDTDYKASAYFPPVRNKCAPIFCAALRFWSTESRSNRRKFQFRRNP